MTREEADTATDSLIDTQIALHTLDLEAYGLADLARHGDYVGRQLTRWRRQVEAGQTRDAPLFFDLHERLVARKPTEHVPPGLAHGDYRFDNVVLDEQFSVAAVLDWELCTIGDPIADFAWSLEYWANADDPVSFLRDPPTASDIFVDTRRRGRPLSIPLWLRGRRPVLLPRLQLVEAGLHCRGRPGPSDRCRPSWTDGPGPGRHGAPYRRSPGPRGRYGRGRPLRSPAPAGQEQPGRNGG